jgi:hypothetical protein
MDSWEGLWESWRLCESAPRHPPPTTLKGLQPGTDTPLWLVGGLLARPKCPRQLTIVPPTLKPEPPSSRSKRAPSRGAAGSEPFPSDDPNPCSQA